MSNQSSNLVNLCFLYLSCLLHPFTFNPRPDFDCNSLWDLSTKFLLKSGNKPYIYFEQLYNTLIQSLFLANTLWSTSNVLLVKCECTCYTHTHTHTVLFTDLVWIIIPHVASPCKFLSKSGNKSSYEQHTFCEQLHYRSTKFLQTCQRHKGQLKSSKGSSLHLGKKKS